MKSLLLSLIVFGVFLFSAFSTRAQSSEDTIEVQTFTYGSELRDWFEFPSDTNTYRKIWLYYKLKCDEGTTADNYPCGEWDYLTYTYLFDHTGQMDSTLFYQANYEVNGETPDSFRYHPSPSWRVSARAEIHPTYSDTNALVTGSIGQGNATTNIPFQTQTTNGKSYLLWTADELSNAGLQAGDISGMQLDIASVGSGVNNLHIAFAPTSRDSLAGGTLPGGNFQTVYARNTTLSDTGWQQLAFTQPFNWDGSSNLLVAFSYQNRQSGSNTQVNATSNLDGMAVSTENDNATLFFKGKDYVEIPAAALASVDEQITISCWVKGNPAYQPQSNFLFEAENAAGERVLNVHLPWSNSRIYWDAGNDDGYDRIEKPASAGEIAGEWHHWVFTKNATTGSMRIYKDGKIWHQGTSNDRPMSGITKMVLGANTDGNTSFDGHLDEFAIWDTVLSEVAIQQLGQYSQANQPQAPNHLLLYYPVDNTTLPTLNDESDNGHDGAMFGYPGIRPSKGHERFFNFQSQTDRPNVTFEQGDFTVDYDTTFVTDTQPLDPLSMVLFNHPAKANIPTDTQTVWPAGFDYTFDQDGNIVDSMPLASNQTIYRNDRGYYGEPFEIVNRYELLRYITPYGIGLDLGEQGDGEGFTWKIDVTDFAPLLADSVELRAGNNQEFLDMKFVMIKGTPPRDVKRIRNVYNGGHTYNDAIETNFLYPKTFETTAEEKTARFRITNTGHGFGGNENCAEFCPKTHRVKINGQKRYDQFLWRDNCAMNPVYPQGGTWIYNRTNWCPGAEVNVDKYQVTPFYTPGDSVTLDYDMEPGYNWNGQGSTPYWRIEAQLITYGAPNFELDAEMEMIIAPNEWKYYKRFNPICANPIVKIKNSGSETLTSLTIHYGVEGGTMHTYDWTGNLAFTESERVKLPLADFGAFEDDARLVARVSEPNGQPDQHAANDVMKTEFEKVPNYPATFTLWLQTNSAPGETYYEILDTDSNVVYKGDNFLANKLYKEEFNLDPGCYRFILYDRDDDGLQFFASPNDGSGYAEFREGFNKFEEFEPNFGSQIAQSFTVGYTMNTEALHHSEAIEIYPNPTEGLFQLKMDHPKAHGSIQIINATGQTVWQANASLEDYQQTIDLSAFGKGMYWVKVKTEEGVITKRVVVQ